MEENKNESQITNNETNSVIQNETIPNQVPQNNNGKKMQSLLQVILL